MTPTERLDGLQKLRARWLAERELETAYRHSDAVRQSVRADLIGAFDDALSAVDIEIQGLKHPHPELG